MAAFKRNLQLLNNRIAEARVVIPEDQPKDIITFGAIVTLKNIASGKIQDFQIVGVDEADIARGKVSFISPLARALINKKTGDTISLKRESDTVIFEILGIVCK